MGSSADAERSPARRDARILFVSDERAWPSQSGYQRRTALILSGLATVGPVTWIAAPRSRSDDGGPLLVPDHLAGSIDAVLTPAPTRSRLATAARWLGGLPWPLAAGDWTAVVAELRERAGDGYDLVWAMGVDALAAVRGAGIDAQVVVDADLESLKLRREIDAGGLAPVRRRIAEIDVARWERLERRAVASTNGFSVCSADEARRLGFGAFVTPNSYPTVADTDRALPRDNLALLFVGSLDYRPNVDGLWWFVNQVLPTLRSRRPTIGLRVVGGGLDPGHPLRRIDGIDVIGPLDDVTDELRRAGAVVVPLRWGAGTRVKILEAFAHRVPVVSTPLGAEGLGLESGRELLLADDGPRFADACLSLLDDDDLAAAIVERADRTFRSSYEESVVRHRLARRVRELVDGVD